MRNIFKTVKLSLKVKRKTNVYYGAFRDNAATIVIMNTVLMMTLYQYHTVMDFLLPMDTPVLYCDSTGTLIVNELARNFIALDKAHFPLRNS